MISNLSTIISQIYKSRNILLQQLHTNNYNIEEYSGFEIKDINILYKNNQLDMVLNNKENTNKIYVKYHTTTIKQTNIQDYIYEIYNIEEILSKTDILMIITFSDINENIKEYLRHLWETEQILVVIQSIHRLQYNILEHTLVPKHTIITDNLEIEQIKNKYNIDNNNQFPRISRFDPVAVVLCVKPGQICKIIRKSKTSVESTYYRMCVNIVI